MVVRKDFAVLSSLMSPSLLSLSLRKTPIAVGTLSTQSLASATLSPTFYSSQSPRPKQL